MHRNNHIGSIFLGLKAKLPKEKKIMYLKSDIHFENLPCLLFLYDMFMNNLEETRDEYWLEIQSKSDELLCHLKNNITTIFFPKSMSINKR